MGKNTLLKARIIQAFFCFMSLFPAGAQAPGMAFGNIGRTPISDDTAIRVEMKNDSYSLLSRQDWDDLRTFGLYFGIANAAWRFELTADSLTDRTELKETGRRVDQLETVLTRKLWAGNLNHSRFAISAGPGAIWLGDAQFIRTQETIHYIDRVERPFPDSYDRPSQSMTGTINVLAEASCQTGFFPVFAYSSLEAGHTGFVRLSEWIEAVPFEGSPGVRLSAGYQWARSYAKGGQSFSETLKSENGFLAGIVFDTGILETGFGYNLQTERQSGYVALTWGGASGARQKKGGAPSGIQAVDIQAWPLMAAVRMRRSAAVRSGTRPIAFSPVLGFESGPIQLSLNGNFLTLYENEQYRYEQAYLGIDTTAQLFQWMDMYIMGAGGVRREQLNSSTAAASVSLAESTSGAVLVEIGTRLYAPNADTTKTDWGAGVSITGLYSRALEKGVRVYAKLFITAAAGRHR